MGAPLCHFEFMSDDPDQCKAFYAKVFGWEYDDKSMPDYTLIKTGKEPEGGLMKRPGERPMRMLKEKGYPVMVRVEERADPQGGRQREARTSGE